MLKPYSVQCFTQGTGLPQSKSPLWNPIHYIFKVLVACSANYCHSACFLILPKLVADFGGIEPRSISAPIPLAAKLCYGGSTSEK
jgi:hypothetical protein